jgi:hypothetical protein
LDRWQELLGPLEQQLSLRTLMPSLVRLGYESNDALVRLEGMEPWTRATASEIATRSRIQTRRGTAQAVCVRIGALLPNWAYVAVTTDGDATLLNLEGRRAVHLSSHEDGSYNPRTPRTVPEFLAQVQAVQARGVRYLLIAHDELSWLAAIPEVHTELRARYDSLCDDDICVLYQLCSPAGA